ncbi:MAG: hypothetical protein U1G07_01400 [Verrucomicrobiota bacterium]
MDELLVLFGHPGHLFSEGTIQLGELLVHGERRFLQLGMATDQFVSLQGVADRGQQLLAQPRLDDKPVDLPFVDRFDNGFQTKHGRDQDPGRVRLDLFGLGKKLQPCHPGHLLVGDDDRERPAFEGFEACQGAACRDHLVTFAAECIAKANENNLLVIEN